MFTLLLKTLPAFGRWFGSTLVIWLAVIFAVLLCPIGCLFIYEQDKRIHMRWAWMTTHDAPADTWWVAGYPKQMNWMHRKFDQAFYDKHAWFRWVCRMCWVCRNPAYNVKQAFGYDQAGMKLLYKRDEGKYWDSGYGNFSFWIAKNARGQYGFMLQYQLFYLGERCLELYWGWKLFRTDPGRICMVASRTTPFLTYPKKTPEQIDIDWKETQDDRDHAEEFWETGIQTW